MPPTSAEEILREVNPNAIPAEAPPAAANYREADLAGITCSGCAKFRFTGEVEEDGGYIPTGYCEQWEANVRGDHVSDAFADPGPTLDENGNEDWEFSASDGEKPLFAEIHLAGTEVKADESGFVIKEVLRTGEWPVIPTKAGKVNKPLRIVRDGKSNPKHGTIALSELVENFKAGAIAAPQIPLSDDENDHKNLTRVNTGFVRDLWIVDDGDTSRLVAKMEFTEPDVREKVLRGTYADVSCGIPWAVNSRGTTYGATVEHVAITNKPFIDGLGPFLAASDDGKADDVEVVAFGEGEPEPEEQQEETPQLSAQEITARADSALRGQLMLSNDYSVSDVKENSVVVKHGFAGTSWTVPFTVEGSDADSASVQLAEVKDWTIEENEEKEEPTPPSPELSDLEQAQRLREIRLSQQTTTKRAKETNMALTREQIEGMELNDEVRTAMLEVLDENASLRASTRESEADRRVDELKELGLSERPGFLKFYRQVMLSDDGGPATILLSDNGQEKERLTAQEILDRAIESLKGSDEKVVLSDQHLASGNDNAPPADAEGEKKSVEERVAETKAELGLDRK